MPGYSRSPLWEKLAAEDEIAAWLFIEENYLEKYKMFVKIEPEWSSSGIWQIHYPGSIGTGPCLVDNYLDLPQSVCDKVQAWQEYFDNNAKPWREKDDPMDYDLFDQWGLEVAREVKRFAPPDYYVEYHWFRELVLVGDKVIHKEIPEYIRKFAKLD